MGLFDVLTQFVSFSGGVKALVVNADSVAQSGDVAINADAHERRGSSGRGGRRSHSRGRSSSRHRHRRHRSKSRHSSKRKSKHQSAGKKKQQQEPGFSGNRNYILWDRCEPMINPSVVFTAESDMIANGNWDLQVNAYAPSGTDAYMQFVMAVTDTGEVQWSIENWPISGDNLFNTCDQPLYQLPSTFLPKGYAISVKMNTDPSSNEVTSVDFSVTDDNGQLVASQTAELNSDLPLCSGEWDPSYLSEVIGFEPNLAGYNGGVEVDFSSGSGTLACRADSISASTSIPSCAETKAGTVESSNLEYSVANQVSKSLVTVAVNASS